VVTAGGIIGEVIHIKETMKDGASTATMEDRITIRSGESRLIVERGRIARVASRTADASPAA
jgi:preprotein translocase subunit YajC